MLGATILYIQKYLLLYYLFLFIYLWKHRYKCRAEFCYLYGLRWKTCGCELWAEDRLVIRVREVVD